MTTLETFLNSPDAVPAITRVLAGETFIHADFLLRPGKDGERRTIAVVYPMDRRNQDLIIPLLDGETPESMRSYLLAAAQMNERRLSETAAPASSPPAA